MLSPQPNKPCNTSSGWWWCCVCLCVCGETKNASSISQIIQSLAYGCIYECVYAMWSYRYARVCASLGRWDSPYNVEKPIYMRIRGIINTKKNKQAMREGEAARRRCSVCCPKMYYSLQARLCARHKSKSVQGGILFRKNNKINILRSSPTISYEGNLQ